MRSRYEKYADPFALKKALEEPLPLDAASTRVDIPLGPGPREPRYALYFLAGTVPLVVFHLMVGFSPDLPTLLLIAGELLMAIAGGVELSGLNRRIQISGEGIRVVKIYGTRTIPWSQVQRVEAKPNLFAMRALGLGIRVSWDCRLIPVEKRKTIIIAIRARLPLGVPIQEWPKEGQLLSHAPRFVLSGAAMGLFFAASFMGVSGSFTGAIQGPCTGDELAQCLEPQAELQSISRPNCDGSDRRVCLVPLGQVRPDLVQNLVDYWGQYGLSIAVLTPSAVPSDIVNPGRGQFDAPTLIDYMGSLFPDAFSDPRAVVIGLTPVDLFDQSSHFRYVFGVKGTTADPKAIISTLRMNPAAYGESSNDELLFSRARKLLARYIGLLYYGLPLNSDRRSPLYESILGPDDLDNMEEDLLLPQVR
jgi:predicted Zn-dependent protease